MLNATKLAGNVGFVLGPTTNTILCYDIRLGNIYKGDKKKNTEERETRDTHMKSFLPGL